VITAQQFKERWERVAGDRLINFPENSLSDVRVPSNVRAFLVEAGLPVQVAPFVDFDPPKNGTLERVSTVWHQSPAFDRYRIIGGNGSGDPICFDEDFGGEVVYLNHDNRFQRVIMASSVFTLAECLVELRDFIAGAGGDADSIRRDQYDALLGRFRVIDPAPSGAGGFWEQEFKCLQPAVGRSWWQFWMKPL